ncbi:hypothetical protein HID58_089684 [Brassica napus]|uniref:Uncharacterized protein n=1 Tax=Brassica napus TaxID=3708 RepID=A0ABQ7XZS0_BRANA|nr:hypothetical protein HID58_089684 [Brassica napus]
MNTKQIDFARRHDSTSEMIKRVVFGYFCKNKKLLRCIEDSSLTRLWFRFIKPKPKSFLANAIDDHGFRYREHFPYKITSMSSRIEDYRYSKTLKGGIFVTRMMERWTIDDAAFDMHDLSEVTMGFTTQTTKNIFPV